MMKTLTIALFSSAAMMTAAVAGTTPSSKNPVAPPPPAAPACSTGISYDNVGLNWNRAFLDGAADDVNSVGIDFSKTIVDRLYFRGKAYYQDSDVWSDWSATAGLGYSVPLLSNVDFVAEAGGLFDDDGEGWYAFPHIRAKVGCLEIHAGAKYQDWSDYQAWEGVANLFYEVAPNIDLNVGGLFADDAQTLQVGVRYKF